MKRRVVVTGMGIISPLGEGVEENWNKLLSGRSAVREIKSFDASTMPTKIAAEVTGFDAAKYIQSRSLKLMPRPVQFAVAAAHLAFADAGLKKGDVPPDRLGVFVGSRGALCDVEELSPALAALSDASDLTDLWERGVRNMHPLWLLRTLANSALCHIAIDHDAQGENCNICNGEAGGLQAIEKAFKAIGWGRIIAAIAGGYDSLVNWQDVTEYSRYGLMTGQNDPPSEGAAFLILEELSHARSRDARVYGEILRAASNSSLPDLDSLYSSRDALNELMEHSQEIDCINVSGLATVLEDIKEAKVAKGAIGNSGVATAPMELVFTMLAIYNDLIPDAQYAMSINMGMGGQNAVIIAGKYSGE
jgi:3-oxoacyl-[acyl-carrier-protein] synthase II